MSLSRPLKNHLNKPDHAHLRNLMDEFDDVATLSPGSDSGVEVPANPPPPQDSSAFQAASSAGSKPLIAEPQDAPKPIGAEAGLTNSGATITHRAAETRAGDHPPERHSRARGGAWRTLKIVGATGGDSDRMISLPMRVVPYACLPRAVRSFFLSTSLLILLQHLTAVPMH